MMTFKLSEWSAYSSAKNTKDTDFVSNHVGPFKVSLKNKPTPGFNISFVSPKFTLFLYLDLVSSALCIRDGLVQFKSSKTNGDYLFKFAPQFSFVGTIKIDSQQERYISGLACLNSVTQLVEPHLTSSHWYFFYFVADGEEKISLTLLHFITSALFHNKELSQGILIMNGDVSGISLNNSVIFIQPKCTEKSGGYAIPTTIQLILDGSGPKGSSDHWHAEIELPLSNCIDSIDILGCLPYLLRKVVQALVSKPYCFQWFDNDVTVYFQRAGKSSTFKGKIYSELLYLS